MAQTDAELLGIRILGWLSADSDRLGAFLGQSGLSGEDLRSRAADPDLLAFVVDFLLGDENALMACCHELGLPPDTPLRARAALPGGDAPHWT
ncbi:MAG: DUF3572 domain-containing protein [Pseudomonadota bacterium]